MNRNRPPLHLVGSSPPPPEPQQPPASDPFAGTYALKKTQKVQVPGAPRWSTDGQHLLRDDRAVISRVVVGDRTIWTVASAETVRNPEAENARFVLLFCESNDFPAILGLSLGQICVMADHALETAGS